MSAAVVLQGPAPKVLLKCPTGIQGLDEITGGGLPRGRPTLVCGSAGCGKTVLAMEFLVHGALMYDEPGLFVCFEERAEDLVQNFASLGFDLEALALQGKLMTDYVHVEPNQMEETGEFDLEGLFIRLGASIDAIGAKRVALDTIETLFSGFSNEAILRAELRRLFQWLKDRGVTAVITGERGDATLTRYGLEEYVADCVIVLDNRITDEVITRRLRVLKYRGSAHGGNEYPFLIDADGISVLPMTSLGLQHAVSTERSSSGIPRLDALLGGQGFYRGSSVLISGTSGTGKSSMAAQLADAACRRGERCIYFAFEESPDQIMRNMSSIGLHLRRWVDAGLLYFHAARPTSAGLEMHLATMLKLIRKFNPSKVIVDPVSNFSSTGRLAPVKFMLVQLIDVLKTSQITGCFTCLTTGGAASDENTVEISSLMDTWLLLRDFETNGERNRGLYIMKSRGLAHSKQVREFLLTDHGVELVDVYSGPVGLFMGSARLEQDQRLAAAVAAYGQDAKRADRAQDRARRVLDAKIAVLQAESEGEQAERSVRELEQRERLQALSVSRLAMDLQRTVDEEPTLNNGSGGHEDSQ
jgi:circadian clock protein KaiC